ncbi:ZIP metal ion transporter, putative [Talaromyces stipitatus ATCC 10500]|uniref:ZIP metal ion transporter, putative n=1 Tax=Talaromyces stipitatus (strain ATCC 10500 / CBS 375.48 / QM 6759 / NRRL 1006) TaxID=441959 RepID=B8M2J6_TALSN|nr:ZIP metal ion transporter, putative [Talaromyces stipitatus ATCC 10500]EED21907.1 ZIP metal ion transporter, putative [Talaromyces stipitatus ATCC 10500]
MVLDANDNRGWIMSGVAGIACVIGASIICVDIILRSCFRIRNFDITTNTTFLSSSMGLSAGVMVTESLRCFRLYIYLARSGLSDSVAAFALIGLFLAGVVVISIFSHIAHRYIPSHVVDCTHTHESHDRDLEHGVEEEHHQHHERGHGCRREYHDIRKDPGENDQITESNERTPLLPSQCNGNNRRPIQTLSTKSTGGLQFRTLYRDSVGRILGRRVTQFLRLSKDVCDENGPCYGFSQTCGIDCRKVLGPRSYFLWMNGRESENHTQASPAVSEPQPRIRADEPDTPLTVRRVPLISQEQTETYRPDSEPQGTDYFSQDIRRTDSSSSPSSQQADEERTATGSQESAGFEPNSKPFEDHPSHASPPHHHHVPQNAFLSIGLQTSLAIALHKLPEGFITYATNHASPTLGMTVFIALFIHNITDGFALALPLFLAIRSRVKAIFWASLLGGISQPAGAGLAALWIWYSNRGKDITEGTSWGVYGGMFAATAGIMTSVGFHLFSEGLSLTHNPNICIFSAIAGMGLLGISFALTA